MITAVMKKYVNGRWVEFDVTEIYSVGQIIQNTHTNGEKYKITSINRSKVTLEKVVDEEVVEGE
jgi:hypothetical protein